MQPARPHIETFDTWFRGLGHIAVAIKNPSSRGDGTLPTGEINEDTVRAVARVNNGRWIADCPFGDNGAELVAEDGLFFCCECRNATVDHAYLPVLMPSDQDRPEIEQLLLARPNEENRNWLPYETVADLARENEEHGIR